MADPRPFRFSLQLSRAPEPTAASWAEAARRAEDAGFSTLTMPDHFGDQLAPVPALAAVAAATSTLRIGSLVFDNDYRHPVVLAKELATLDVLSDGRLELSLGAGWMKSDYEQSGIAYDPPAARVDRFEEALDVVCGLLASDDPFSYDGRHYQVHDHRLWPRPRQRPRPPLVIGGGGRRVLTIAGRKADVVSINADLREGTGGAETAPNLTPDATRRKIGWVRDAAGDRFDELELHCLIGFVHVTDDRDGLLSAMAPAFGLEPEDAGHVPAALVGTLEQMEEELQWRRQEYGISYFTVESDSWSALAPLVAKLAGT